MIYVVHVTSGEQRTRIQLSYAEVAVPLCFYLRSRGHAVRYYCVAEPIYIDMPETARVVCLMREYGGHRRKVK